MCVSPQVCPYDYERIRFVLHHLLLRAGDDKSSSHHQQVSCQSAGRDGGREGERGD